MELRPREEERLGEYNSSFCSLLNQMGLEPLAQIFNTSLEERTRILEELGFRIVYQFKSGSYLGIACQDLNVKKISFAYIPELKTPHEAMLRHMSSLMGYDLKSDGEHTPIISGIFGADWLNPPYSPQDYSKHHVNLGDFIREIEAFADETSGVKWLKDWVD